MPSEHDPFGQQDPAMINRQLSQISAQLADIRRAEILRSPIWTIAWGVVLSYFCLLFIFLLLCVVFFLLLPTMLWQINKQIDKYNEQRWQQLYGPGATPSATPAPQVPTRTDGSIDWKQMHREAAPTPPSTGGGPPPR